MSLSGTFAAISETSAALVPGAYVVEFLETAQPILLACSNDGRPGLFVELSEMGDSPGFRLRNLELRHGTQGDLRTSDGKSVEGTYTLIECLSHDSRLHRSFLELAFEVITNGANWRSASELEHAFTSLIELFSAASTLPTSSWLGTWGELFLIHSSNDSENLLNCWHTDPLNLHDFALGSDRIECKTTQGQIRSHEFSLGQLDETHRVIYVASIMTHENPGGVSALELYDEIRQIVRNSNLLTHLDRIIAMMLGEELENFTPPRFDYDEALKSIRIVPAKTVPCPTNPSPQLVHSVRFKSDISGCESASNDSELLKMVTRSSIDGLP